MIRWFVVDVFVGFVFSVALVLFLRGQDTCPPIQEPEKTGLNELTWVMPSDAKKMTVVLYKPDGRFDGQYTISDWVPLPPGTTLKIIAK